MQPREAPTDRQEFGVSAGSDARSKSVFTPKMSSDLQTLLTEAERSFRKACEQIVQLNRRLDEMAKRYDKASRENHRSFRYSLRLRMAVTEGVRNMYYEYAANKADEITQLRCQVLREVRAGDDNDAEPIDVEGGGGGGEEEQEEGDNHSESNFVELNVGRDMLRNNRMLNDTGVSDGAMGDDEEEEEEDFSGSDMQEQEEEEEANTEGSVVDAENDTTLMSENNMEQEEDMDSVTSDSSVPGTSATPCGAVA